MTGTWVISTMIEIFPEKVILKSIKKYKKNKKYDIISTKVKWIAKINGYMLITLSTVTIHN